MRLEMQTKQEVMKTTPILPHIPLQPFTLTTRRRTRVLAVAPSILAIVAVASIVQAQSDDFNDGNDNGWFQYNPLQKFGIRSTFTFPDGGYRIQTLDPTGMEANPGRAGSIRTDVAYTDFYVTVDLVNWKDDTQQAFGLLGRVGTPGLQQTTGYAFTYERGSGVTPTSGDFDISVITNEAPSQLPTGESSYHLDPSKDYRFVFKGKGTILEGLVYELPNTKTPVLHLTTSDATYPSGYCGLVVYDNSGGNGVTDTTFDNYFALPEEPPVLSIQYFPAELGLFVTWPAMFTGYQLESTPVLPALEWTEEPDVFVEGEVYKHIEASDFGDKFFRLKKNLTPAPAR
jgi:hypothetical protein